MKILDELYQQLIKLSIKENRKVSRQLKAPLNNYHQLYNQVEIPFKEDRTVNIRHVKIPTFIRKNKPQYYTIYLTNTEYIRLGELQEIHSQCIECIDKTNVDSYTIFLISKLYGHIDPVTNKPFRWYKIYVINTCDANKEHINRILFTIENFLTVRCKQLQKDGLVFGNIKEDLQRIERFIEILKLMQQNVISIYSTNISRSINRSSTNVSTNINRRGGKTK